jgi:hypothetical protein
MEQFSKEVQMANKHLKTCSTSFAIKEMQIKTSSRFHFTPLRMAIIKQTRSCVVIHIYNPSYLGGRGRRIVVQGRPRQKWETI